MVTNQSVALDIPSGLTVIATRDDQPFEYVPGEPVEESGVYRFEFQEDRVDYTVNYDRPPFFTFRIVDEAVNDMEILKMCIRDRSWRFLDLDSAWRCPRPSP